MPMVSVSHLAKNFAGEANAQVAAVNDISVTWVGAASGTSGDIHVLADEFYPVVY